MPSVLPSPPAPVVRVALGPFLRTRGQWHRFFAECAEKYGDVVRLTLIPSSVLVSHPRDIEQVLLTNQRNFTKHFAIRRNRTMFGEGLMSAEGEEWLKQRRRAQPSFGRSRLEAYATVIVEETERMLAEWRPGERRDVHHDASDLALSIVARLLIGADVHGEDRELGAAVHAGMDAFARRHHYHLFFRETTPFPANLRLQRAVRRIEAIMMERVARRTGEEQDILADIERAAAGAGRPLSTKERWDLLLTLFQAGQHTTAAALSWTWLLLDRHPEARAALEREAFAVLGDRPATRADLPQLTLTQNVVRESLRLYPPVWSFGRRAVADCELGGFHIPGGTTILMSQWVVHRDPRWFDEPEAFRPERWADGLDERLPRFALFPFGGGPRLCIGESFAMTEMMLILATVARRFRLAAPRGKVVEQPAFTLRPRGGLPMTISTVTRDRVSASPLTTPGAAG